MHYSWHYTNLVLLAAKIAIFAVVLGAILFLVYRYLIWRWLVRREMVLLELTPPASSNRSPQATEKLFDVIHGLRNTRSFKDRLLGRRIVLALEVDAARDSGIRYVIQVSKRLAASLHQAINAYVPDAKVEFIQDNSIAPTRIVSFRQSGHYAFPLALHEAPDQHDPLAYVTAAMTKLETSERMRLQIVLTPVKLKEAGLLAYKILRNEDLLNHLSSHKVPLVPKLMHAINSTLFGITGAIGEIHHGSTTSSYKASQSDSRDKLQVAKHLRPARTLSAFELELMESIHRKLRQPLFRVGLRVGIVSGNSNEVKSRLAAFKSALESYSVPSYQGFKRQKTISKLQNYSFVHRLPAFFARHDNVLSASEVASLYHFPISSVSKTDNLVTSLSRTLPAPISLKQNKDLDVVLGMNDHHGTKTAIGLTEAERERHVYIIGGTGNGKTTMLQYAIVQDMQKGKGLAVIDPHGDMALTMLEHVPEERINEVVYVNPDDLTHPIGINLLELPEGLTGDELLREKDLITESTISVLRKIFSDDDSGGHRIEYILRNTIQTALTLEGSTLFTIFRLLNDTKYRKDIVKNLEDNDLKIFWQNELGKAGDFQKVKMSAGITAKIGRFLFSASAKRILEQEKSTIDFDDILNSGKILICNFSKGLLGEDTSALFGITILAKLQVASLRRARLRQSDRRPYYLYVDEFQNFATMSFVQMLSEARKYKLYLTMAEQSTSQQDQQRLVDIILANVGTVICFRSASPADERYLLPLFSPFIEQGEIANLPTYNFYMRIAAMQAYEPMSGETLLLDRDGNEQIADQVIEHSRLLYAKKVETAVVKKKQADPKPKQGSVPAPKAKCEDYKQTSEHGTEATVFEKA